MIKILLSNDDGFIAPGVNLLREGLTEIANVEEVLTVTPDTDKSATSNSLTLGNPLRLTERGDNFYSLNGTPADSVNVALAEFYGDAQPDVVISGINSAPNMGDDVLYSGTVAAALEGRHLKLPSIAVSMDFFDPQYYESGVEAVLSLLKILPEFPVSKEKHITTILNVNVPDRPWDEIKGFKVTRLGSRAKSLPAIKQKDPRGKDIFWIGPVGDIVDAQEGTDFFATQEGYISVTPLHIDLTQYDMLDSTNDWLTQAGLDKALKSRKVI